MKYLVNKNKESGRAHLWDEGDTYCKMYSTGGLRKKRYEVVDDKEDKEVCLMCQNVWNEIHTFTGGNHV
jgi:hypothetical protein